MIFDLIPPQQPNQRKAEEEKILSLVETRMPHRQRSVIKIASLTTAILLIIGGTFYTLGIRSFARDASSALGRIKESMGVVKKAGSTLDAQKAENAFAKIEKEFLALKEQASTLKLFSLASLIGSTTGAYAGIPESFNTALAMSSESKNLAASLDNLKKNGFSWIMSRESESLVGAFKQASTHLETLGNLASTLERTMPEFLKMHVGALMNPAHTDLEKGEVFLQTFIAWISHPAPRHIAILFQNPSEIRPGGGFLGSFADATLERGTLVSLNVWDIYDVDGQLKERIAPPPELSTITPTWGARDANWFLDFPTSAKKTLDLLEKSLIHKERAQRFDGAIAINTNVLTSLLNATGPITLPQFGITLTSENALEELQREVESGKAKAEGEPKRIIKELAPILFEKLGMLDETGKVALVRAITDHIAQKDLMIFLREPAFQSYLETLDATGSLFTPDDQFEGSTLAISRANIGAGKTDAVMHDLVGLTINLKSDGSAEQSLAITQIHNGKPDGDYWYRVPNKRIIKVHAPQNARLLETRGVLPLPAFVEPDSTLAKDPDLHAIESTRTHAREFSVDELKERKNTVYEFLSKTAPEQSSETLLRYESLNVFNPDGRARIPLTFVFDAQSGVPAELSMTVRAPQEYIFEETKNAECSAERTAPEARVALTCTLIKN